MVSGPATLEKTFFTSIVRAMSLYVLINLRIQLEISVMMISLKFRAIF